MNKEKLKEQVDYVISLAGDDEIAHSREDELRLEVIREFCPDWVVEEIEGVTKAELVGAPVEKIKEKDDKGKKKDSKESKVKKPLDEEAKEKDTTKETQKEEKNAEAKEEAKPEQKKEVKTEKPVEKTEPKQ